MTKTGLNGFDNITFVELSHCISVRNKTNYENVIKYFDFQKAVRAVIWNQN